MSNGFTAPQSAFTKSPVNFDETCCGRPPMVPVKL